MSTTMDKSQRVRSDKDDSTSSFRVGRGLPTLMAATYVLAVILAVVHFLLFRTLSGRPAEGPYGHVDQTYATTASMLIASTFGLSLKSSLCLAFTQYLWYLLRQAPLKVSTVEALFSMRSSPKALFDSASVIKASPLVLITAVIWLIPIATSFPPGSLTVVAGSRTDVVSIDVPTFNASDTGNWTLSYLSEQSVTDFGSIAYNSTVYFCNMLDSPDSPNIQARTMIDRVLLDGNIRVSPSPTGGNCSYTTSFIGPFLQCTENSHGWTSVFSYADVKDSYGLKPYSIPIYNASLYFPPRDMENAYSSSTSFENATTSFNVTTNRVDDVGFKTAPLNATHDMKSYKLKILQTQLSCLPSKAKYQVYTSNQQNSDEMDISVHPDSVSVLSNVLDPFPGVWEWQEYDSLPISPASATYIQDSNLLSLMLRMATRLDGTIPCYVYPDITAQPLRTDEQGFLYLPFTLDTSDHIDDSVDIFAPYTRMLRSLQSAEFVEQHRFSLSQDSLNAVLANISASAISELNVWKARANVTEERLVGTYRFSRPLNLILPYSITLLCSLPCIVLGFIALYSNGVPAIDGGFVQLLTTTRGSPTLDNACAGGSLGGENNMPRGLMKVEVQYGELVPQARKGNGECASTLKRAGFGAKTEVLPLNKRYLYG